MQAKSDITGITSSIEHPLPVASKSKPEDISEKATEESECCTSSTKPNEVGETLHATADNFSHNKHNSPSIARAASIQNQQQSTTVQNDAEGDNASEISDFSDFSQESWQPVQGPIAWVQEQMRRGQSPHKILEDLVPSGTVIPEGLDPLMLWKIIISIVSEPPKRKKLTDINTLDDVLKLLKNSKKIMVLTGAGVSVSCGIPDFRSRDGIYARLAKDFPNLPDPQAMFDIHFFRSDPRPFFKFAKEIYPGQFRPSPCHFFIRLLEEKGKLLRNYTQNIDTLEQVAGIHHVVQCHGSFATASCTICGYKVDSDAIKDDIFNQVIPRCPKCPATVQNAVMKPDIVFFGESLPEHFHNQMATDKDECDLLIVIGSSLKVRPVALIPNSLPAHVPQILINRERLHHFNFDVELLGNCDGIIGELCRRLGPGWEELATPGPPLDEVTLSSLPTPPLSPESVESRGSAYCKSDEAVSPTVTTREAYINSASNPEDEAANSSTDCPVSSAVEAEKVSSPVSKTSEQLPSGAQADDDDDVNEVVTSQSDSACAKAHKAHHHKHSGKWTFTSSRNSLALTDCVTADTTNDHSCSPDIDNPVNNSCSSQEIETLVSACHKKDVMYVPNKKSHSHYWQTNSFHNHHSLEQQAVVHTSCAHDSDQLEDGDTPEKQKTLCQQEHPDSQHCKKTEKSPHTSGDAPEADSQPDSQHCKKTEKRPHTSGDAPEADSQEGEQCSDVKRQRLESHDEDGLDKEAAINRSDSMSQDGSLEDIRKMWCSKSRVSLAHRMSENQVLYLPPSSYVFKGAEVYTDSETSDSSDEDEEDDCDDSEESSASSGAESDSSPDQSHSAHRQGAGDVGLADSSGVKVSEAKELPCSDELHENECLPVPDIPQDINAVSTCQVSSTDDVKQS